MIWKCFLHRQCTLKFVQPSIKVIHEEFGDLFSQLAQIWLTWAYNAYNVETPWKHFLHMVLWTESFDLPPTDCLAGCSGKYVRRQQMSHFLPFDECNLLVNGSSSQKGTVMWRASQFPDVIKEVETKWPLFTRRHFQMHFLEWKYMNFD